MAGMASSVMVIVGFWRLAMPAASIGPSWHASVPTTEAVLCHDVQSSGHIDRGAQSEDYSGVSDRRALGTSACARRSNSPEQEGTQLPGRLISEKAFVIRECREGFEKIELSPLNGPAQQRRGWRDDYLKKQSCLAVY